MTGKIYSRPYVIVRSTVVLCAHSLSCAEAPSCWVFLLGIKNSKSLKNGKHAVDDGREKRQEPLPYNVSKKALNFLRRLELGGVLDKYKQKIWQRPVFSLPFPSSPTPTHFPFSLSLVSVQHKE